jgi:predicted transcriptional regulator
MPQERTTIAIPPALRDLIAECADAERMTHDALADAALRRQIEVAQAAHERGERLAVRYLTDPRLATAGQSAPSVHISRATNTRAQNLAATMGNELGRNVPKGRAIQALLWAELAPLPADAPRDVLPAPPTLDSVTVNIPAALNTALRNLALRRATSREAVVGDLLAQGLAELDANSSVPAELRADVRVQSADGRGKVTIRVARTYDRRLSQLADERFAGTKSHALQALLWRGLDRAGDEPPAAQPDRPVMLSGALYARVARLALDLRDVRGRVVPIKEFVEDAVARAVEREERRLQRLKR